MRYKVLIPTSGIESRLGEITNYTNKALIKIGKKPIISYIIDAYPQDTEFVITIGHFRDHIRDFIKLVYPHKKIKLVEVDKYQGKGSSQGYSMLQAKDFLQSPFIYQACDTIVTKSIPEPSKNWLAGFRGGESSHYASFDMVNGKALKILDRGAIGSDYLHIGLVGIKDYRKFWDIADSFHRQNPNQVFNDSMIINQMIENDIEFGVKEYDSWHDTGNLESLKKARAEIADSFHILDKLEESIFFIGNHVIKFFYDDKMVSERVKRAKILSGLVPIMKGHKKNFYKYEHVKGDLYSKVANPVNFAHFLDWAQSYLWRDAKETSPQDFRQRCFDFYCKKTIERIEKFYQTRAVQDEENIINQEKVPTMKEIIGKVDFNWLARARQSHFHGDFCLDNIIKTKRGYCLLDWRQNFGGLHRAGDMYYDLAKLNHNLTVNHDIVNDNLFTIKIKKNVVECDILRKNNLVLCQDLLFHFLQEHNYNYKKVKALTALIWLNSSPLHHHPYDLFLHYYGKLNLWRAIKNG